MFKWSNCWIYCGLSTGWKGRKSIRPRNVKMASSQDAWYLSLLGLAENFRTSSPPNIKSCIQCLQAVFNFKPPPRVEARTHLQLGNILLTHTKNIDLARSHLEQAVSFYSKFYWFSYLIPFISGHLHSHPYYMTYYLFWELHNDDTSFLTSFYVLMSILFMLLSTGAFWTYF